MQIITQTKRLLIREFIPTDLEEIRILHADPKVLAYSGDALMTRDDEVEELLNSISEQYTNNGYAPWAVHEKKGGRMLGWCGIIQQQNQTVLEVRFKKKFWNKGYATEACSAVIGYAFDKHPINEIIAKSNPANEAMLAILNKLGFLQTSIENHKGAEKIVFKLSKPDFKNATQ